MFLRATTDITLGELNADRGLLTHFKVQICDTGPHGEDETLIGKASLTRIHVKLTGAVGENLLDVCDADSQDMHEVQAEYLDEVESMIKSRDSEQWSFEETWDGDVLVIRDIEVDEARRGMGLEAAVAARIIVTIGADCELVVLTYASKAELALYHPLGFEPVNAEAERGLAHLLPTDELGRVDPVFDDEFRVVAFDWSRLTEQARYIAQQERNAQQERQLERIRRQAYRLRLAEINFQIDRARRFIQEHRLEPVPEGRTSEDK